MKVAPSLVIQAIMKNGFFSLLALNGWQRIKRVDGNSLMSWGSQIQFKPSSNITLNYSTFIGTDKPDSARLMRIFHNIYGIFNVTEKLGITAGFDIGTEEKGATGNGTNTWYSPVGILRYAFNDQWALAGRVEYYKDENGVIVATGTPKGFQTMGYSLNVDYSPAKNVLVRIEGRTLNSKDAVFIKGNEQVKNEYAYNGVCCRQLLVSRYPILYSSIFLYSVVNPIFSNRAVSVLLPFV
jgi:hypothetical protein